jgi:general secretion pathway protein A
MKLNRWLLDRFRAGETTALIVDEAQNLTYPVLEEIRLLTNLETSTEKLLQIVLSGQPELEDKLKSPQLRQLRQRIMLRCKTTPLTEKQTNDYIIERLRIAGSDGKPIFSPGAIGIIHKYSVGIPRVVNLLCSSMPMSNSNVLPPQRLFKTWRTNSNWTKSRRTARASLTRKQIKDLR